MEKFTHVHPILPLLIWGPVSATMAYVSFQLYNFSALAGAGLILLGLFFWTLTEYVLHRFLFHFKAVGPFQERLLWLLHGLHHDDPQDPTRLVMPPVMSILLSIPLYSLFSATFALISQPHGVAPFFSGFLVGYLCYDYTHYAVHHFHPKTSFGKFVKQHHMLHHFADYESRWGVSSPIWDHVFGTASASSTPVRKGTYTPVSVEVAKKSFFAAPLGKQSAKPHFDSGLPQQSVVHPEAFSKAANNSSGYNRSEV